MIPLREDRWFLYAFLAVLLIIVPQVADDYWFGAILIPLLVFSIAELGLNIVTGYTGQLSLGSAGFMLLGAVATFNFMFHFSGEKALFDMPLPVALFLAGIVTGLVGVVFGLPSIRVKGFYLIVSTLAAHFFILWFFNK